VLAIQQHEKINAKKREEKRTERGNVQNGKKKNIACVKHTYTMKNVFNDQLYAFTTF
jgi:hypothetical protein